MNVEMLKLAATYYQCTRRSEIDQPHTIGGSVRVEAKLCDSGAKNIIPPTFALKSPERF